MTYEDFRIGAKEKKSFTTLRPTPLHAIPRKGPRLPSLQNCKSCGDCDVHWHVGKTLLINESRCILDCPPQKKGWLHVEFKGWPNVFIIARQDIPAGAELTIDYGEGCAVSICRFFSARHLCCSVLLSCSHRRCYKNPCALINLFRYWMSLDRDQNDFGMLITSHEEANKVLIAPGCDDVPIVLS